MSEKPEVKPKLGDLIEIDWIDYQHWAIYIGNGYVVYLAPKNEVPRAGLSILRSVATDHAVVKKEPLLEVVGNDKYTVNNKYDGRFQPLSEGEIIARANANVGKVMDYSVLSQNCEHFITGLRYGNKVNPQPGDLIEIFRPVCQHWAIYVGNGDVVHLVPEGNLSGSDSSGLGSFGSFGFGSSDSSSCAVVRKDPLRKVGGGKYQINNKYDARCKPHPVDKIVSEAKAAVGEKMSYNLLSFNCEHFVTKLRYGTPFCDQVNNIASLSGTG